jgi:hypothetical protein
VTLVISASPLFHHPLEVAVESPNVFVIPQR